MSIYLINLGIKEDKKNKHKNYGIRISDIIDDGSSNLACPHTISSTHAGI